MRQLYGQVEEFVTHRTTKLVVVGTVISAAMVVPILRSVYLVQGYLIFFDG